MNDFRICEIVRQVLLGLLAVRLNDGTTSFETSLLSTDCEKNMVWPLCTCMSRTLVHTKYTSNQNKILIFLGRLSFNSHVQIMSSLTVIITEKVLTESLNFLPKPKTRTINTPLIVCVTRGCFNLSCGYSSCLHKSSLLL